MTRSIVRPALAAGLLVGSLLAAAHASAQVIYEPVRYQYGSGCNVYYYGGSNPRVLDFADNAPAACDHRYYVARSVPVVKRQVVYSDATGYRDAADLGYTPNDARNEAYDSVPRYFRKANLRWMATATPGGWVVPAHAEPREAGVRRSLPVPEPTPPGTILIIPRKLLEKKSEPSVVMAK